MKRKIESYNKTLVFGASLNPERISHKVIHRLEAYGVNVVAVGEREGSIGNIYVKTGDIQFEDIHTITLYMGEKRQVNYLDYLLSLEPKRIIFNPGAENISLFIKARELGIEVLNACTMVMLATGQY